MVEDWVESYQGAAGDDAAEKEAVHQLVLFLVRCCGLSVDVDEDEAMDMDGIQDVVERIEEESAQVCISLQSCLGVEHGRGEAGFDCHADE
jgi:cohesin complex subunit SA-1/2